jgi:hypothetical protein
MPRCVNGPQTKGASPVGYFTGNEPSPKAKGRCARHESVGTVALGGDGKRWTVKCNVNGVKSWRRAVDGTKAVRASSAPGLPARAKATRPNAYDKLIAAANCVSWHPPTGPVESATVSGDGWKTSRPITRAKLNEIVLPIGSPSVIRLPIVGDKVYKQRRVMLPATLGDVMKAVRSMYARRATLSDVKAVRKAAKDDDGLWREYERAKGVESRIARGLSPTTHELCGNHFFEGFRPGAGRWFDVSFGT